MLEEGRVDPVPGVGPQHPGARPLRRHLGDGRHLPGVLPGPVAGVPPPEAEVVGVPLKVEGPPGEPGRPELGGEGGAEARGQTEVVHHHGHAGAAEGGQGGPLGDGGMGGLKGRHHGVPAPHVPREWPAVGCRRGPRADLVAVLLVRAPIVGARLEGGPDAAPNCLGPPAPFLAARVSVTPAPIPAAVAGSPLAAAAGEGEGGAAVTELAHEPLRAGEGAEAGPDHVFGQARAHRPQYRGVPLGGLAVLHLGSGSI